MGFPPTGQLTGMEGAQKNPINPNRGLAFLITFICRYVHFCEKVTVSMPILCVNRRTYAELG